MRRRRHESESPWASFADALSGMLFVFVITTFWFAWQLAVATAAMREQEAEARQERVKITSAADKARQLTDAAEPDSVTTCLAETGPPGAALDVTAQVSEARISLYVKGVEWFAKNEATLGARQQEAVERVRHCVERLVVRQESGRDLEAYRLRVYLEGHTDAEPFKPGAVQSNWELSGQRAAAVLRSVLAQGSMLKNAQEEGRLDLYAVGMADRHPTWRRICEAALDADGMATDAEDTALCERFNDLASDSTAELGAVLRENPAVFAMDEQCKEVSDARTAEVVRETPAPELLRWWANRCVRKGYAEARLKMLRRVDLRLELSPRLGEDPA